MLVLVQHMWKKETLFFRSEIEVMQKQAHMMLLVSPLNVCNACSCWLVGRKSIKIPFLSPRGLMVMGKKRGAGDGIWFRRFFFPSFFSFMWSRIIFNDLTADARRLLPFRWSQSNWLQCNGIYMAKGMECAKSYAIRYIAHNIAWNFNIHYKPSEISNFRKQRLILLSKIKKKLAITFSLMQPVSNFGEVKVSLMPPHSLYKLYAYLNETKNKLWKNNQKTTVLFWVRNLCVCVWTFLLLQFVLVAKRPLKVCSGPRTDLRR